jgi:hypothetical protein
MSAIRRNEPVREWGRYGYQTINTFLANAPGFGFGAPSLLGMPLQTQWLYGSFKAVDSETYYAALRHYNVTGALTLLLYEATPGTDFRFLKEAHGCYKGGVFGGQRGDRWGVWDVRSTGDRQHFTLNVGPDGQTDWVERDLIDVGGVQVGDLMQSAVPDLQSPMIYTSRCTKASGRVMGDDVEGFFFQDFHHLGVGQDWLVTEFFHGVQGIWVVAVTEYEDGSWDIGNFFAGKGGFNSGLVQRSTGERIATTEMEIEVDFDDKDFVKQARFILEPGEVWEWNYRYPDGHPRIPVMKVVGSPHWNEGIVTRVGDGRTPKLAEAWMEIYPSTLKAMLGERS